MVVLFGFDRFTLLLWHLLYFFTVIIKLLAAFLILLLSRRLLSSIRSSSSTNFGRHQLDPKRLPTTVVRRLSIRRVWRRPGKTHERFLLFSRRHLVQLRCFLVTVPAGRGC